MSTTSRLVRFGTLILTDGTLTACAAAMQVHSFTERGAEFNRYRTYGFAAPDLFSTGDPRLDNNPFFQERVRVAVAKQLAARGYEKTASSTPDLLIHVHASVTQEINVNELDRNAGYCRSGDCGSFVYDAGTLLLDLVDGHTNHLAWRGWSEGSIDGVVDDQAWMEQRIDDAVTRILARLPRRS